MTSILNIDARMALSHENNQWHVLELGRFVMAFDTKEEAKRFAKYYCEAMGE